MSHAVSCAAVSELHSIIVTSSRRRPFPPAWTSRNTQTICIPQKVEAVGYNWGLPGLLWSSLGAVSFRGSTGLQSNTRRCPMELHRIHA